MSREAPPATVCVATHGSLSAFDPALEDWTTYIERVNFYFEANEVTAAEKKRSIFLSSCGTATFKLARSLVEEGRLSDTPYDTICTLLKDYYQPKPSVIVQRFKFYSRVRSPGETIAAYMAALRALAEHCAYSTPELLKEMLRDRLVCGVNHAGIQRKLLAEKDLTYDKAVSLATSIEASERDSRNLRAGKASPENVNYQAAGTGAAGARNTGGGVKKPQEQSFKQGSITCYRCGGPHLAPSCKFKDKVCRYCKKKGHLEKVCRAKTKQRQTNHYLDECDEQEGLEEDIFNISDQKCAPIVIHLTLSDLPVTMEVDTGASTTVISNETFRRIQQIKHVDLQPARVRLKTYTGESIPVLGCATLQARYDKHQSDVCVHVVSGDGPNLLGRDLLKQLEVDMGSIHNTSVHDNSPLNEVLQKYKEVFSPDLGCLKDTEIHLPVDEKVQPKFHKPRTVPFVFREKVEAELERLQSIGVISPVKTAKWAAPIVPVLKKNGSVRICGGYKVTANKALLPDNYPLPRIDEMVTALAGGETFTKLDLANAYLQLPLDEQSKEYLTVNTHKGLFRYNRLPFGITSAPAIFQRCMDTLLQGIPGVKCYIDDIIVTGRTQEEHLRNLEAVLQKLLEAGLRIKLEKSKFMQPSIEYLGFIIDKNGRHPTNDKIQAIREAPTPKDVTQLRSFLGMLTYYGNFLPNLSSKLTPLYDLLAKNRKWVWGVEQINAFQKAKDALQTDSLLVHFDPEKPLILACDASDYGVGAVLSHVMEDGQERPIAYTSRTLNPAEKRYSQLDKEALAIITGVKKFHNYIYGRMFTIQSDHKPLSYLFDEHKEVPQHASARIQRWALILSAYRYNIRYKSGKTLNNADALSRLPSPLIGLTCNSDPPPVVVDLINHLSTTCICAANIKEWTSKDPTLARVKRFLLSGWPAKPPDATFAPYFNKKTELSLQDGCILWGTRVIVPPPGRKGVLQELHETHPGVSRMKSLARCYIWWPKMDADIAEMVRACNTCQESRPSPAAAPLHPWVWPEKPWSRLHIDFAGPYMGSMYLVLVDAHSKWMEVVMMKNITTASTIEKLRIIFATHGLPRKIVTDNGPSFTSHQFKEFMSKNGILHITSAPYHPSTNGLAERAVQSFKQGIKRTPGDSIQDRLSRYLFKYRVTPHTTTGIPPAELLMGRRLTCRLDLLHPELQQKVQAQQMKQKCDHDNSKALRVFQAGDLVFAQNFADLPPKWLPGRIHKVTGPLSYEVELLSGSIVRRHVDNLRSRSLTPTTPPDPEADSDDTDDFLTLPDLPADPVPSPEQNLPADPIPPPEPSGEVQPAIVLPAATPPQEQQPPPPRNPSIVNSRRQSTRPHNPPDYLRYN